MAQWTPWRIVRALSILVVLAAIVAQAKVLADAGSFDVTRFFVVIVLLSGVDVQLQLVWVDIVLHKIFPVIVVLDWLLDPPHVRLAMRDIGVLIVYPLVWTALTMIRGAVDPAHWYPYPFLDPKNGGYGQVLITAVAVTIGFVAISAAIIWLGNWRRAAATPSLRAA